MTSRRALSPSRKATPAEHRALAPPLQRALPLSWKLSRELEDIRHDLEIAGTVVAATLAALERHRTADTFDAAQCLQTCLSEPIDASIERLARLILEIEGCTPAS